MSIRELTCPAHDHPVGPDDRYCGACGAALFNPVEGVRRTWPKLVPVSDAPPASVTPIRSEAEFKPLDFTSDPHGPGRRFARTGLGFVATLACAALLVTSELKLSGGFDESVWVVTWLASYAATVIAAAGWFYLVIQRVRKGRRPAGHDLASAH